MGLSKKIFAFLILLAASNVSAGQVTISFSGVIDQKYIGGSYDPFGLLIKTGDLFFGAYTFDTALVNLGTYTQGYYASNNQNLGITFAIGSYAGGSNSAASALKYRSIIDPLYGPEKIQDIQTQDFLFGGEVAYFVQLYLVGPIVDGASNVLLSGQAPDLSLLSQAYFGFGVGQSGSSEVVTYSGTITSVVAVPTPGTYTLMLTGIVALGVLDRRRKVRSSSPLNGNNLFRVILGKGNLGHGQRDPSACTTERASSLRSTHCAVF